MDAKIANNSNSHKIISGKPTNPHKFHLLDDKNTP